jgi:aminoglycoside phosphotransferase (APT) family kinase protein
MACAAASTEARGEPPAGADASRGPNFFSASRQVAQDWPALARHLAGAGFQFDPAVAPRQFSNGFGNLNYLIHMDGAPWVLRRPPMGTIPPGANDMAREFKILSRLWQRFPLAPRAVHFCGDAGVLGAAFLLMEYRPGLVISGSLPADRPLDRLERNALGRSLIDILGDLHAIEPAEVGLDDLGKPEGMLARMIGGWHKRGLLAAEPMQQGVGEIDEIAAWLAQRLPRSARTCLLHNDFKLDNVILDRHSLAPRAVIDWDMGTRGDPMVDVATLLSYWCEADDPPVMHQLGQMPTAEPGFPSRAEVLHQYALRTGSSLENFLFYRVLALFKLAVVFMQLHAQYLREEVSDPRYAKFGSLSAGLLDHTRAVAAGRLN